MNRPTSQYHTIVVSDLHLSDAEPARANNPLWKKFRRKDYFIDDSFSNFLDFMQKKIDAAAIELVLNGDIFDFDSITAIPKKPSFEVSHMEKRFGLDSTEEKSLFKINLILKDHSLWVESLSNFVREGNHLIFIIGNHDIELYWPKVQKAILDKLDLPDNLRAHVRFCEWFYVSQGDTLIEHGHQYDPYCMAIDPVHPLIVKNGKYKMRLPFGNLANRYMVNDMGLKNPHSDDSFVKSSMDFARFFFKYEAKIQPFMIFTWLLGSLRTLFTSINEGLYPTLKDPLTFDDRVKQIAYRSNSIPSVVLNLKENHAHPAVLRPFMVLRELWLDRAFLLAIIVAACWQIFTTSHLFANVSLWWFAVPLMTCLPFFIYYSHGVKSDVRENARKAVERTPLSAKAAGVTRVIHGHTHLPEHFRLEDIEYINTGTWSPRFRDPECKQPWGNQHFAWINGSQNRQAGLFIWKNPDAIETEAINATTLKNTKKNAESNFEMAGL